MGVSFRLFTLHCIILQHSEMACLRLLVASLLVVLCVAQKGFIPPKQLPAGVNPAVCLTYPFCPQLLNPATGTVIMTIPGYPAGVNPLACPNYPFCDNTVNALTGVRNTPAGVHPAGHPNRPN